MTEIKLSDETATKILKGLEGDSALRDWAIDYLSNCLKTRARKYKILQYAQEWMTEFISESQWYAPRFKHIVDMLMEDPWHKGNKTEMVDDWVHGMMEGMSSYLYWDEKTEMVIWSPYCHRDPPFPIEYSDLANMLNYINEKLYS